MSCRMPVQLAGLVAVPDALRQQRRQAVEELLRGQDVAGPAGLGRGQQLACAQQHQDARQVGRAGGVVPPRPRPPPGPSAAGAPTSAPCPAPGRAGPPRRRPTRSSRAFVASLSLRVIIRSSSSPTGSWVTESAPRAARCRRRAARPSRTGSPSPSSPLRDLPQHRHQDRHLDRARRRDHPAPRRCRPARRSGPPPRPRRAPGPRRPGPPGLGQVGQAAWPGGTRGSEVGPWQGSMPVSGAGPGM